LLAWRAWTATSSNFGERGYRHPILRDGVNIQLPHTTNWVL
jgi:hypothetical protein